MNKIDLANISPLVNDLCHYKISWLHKDIIAGLSVAAVQVPTAIAYAQLAGFSPEIGLYASILPVIVYGFFGSSRQLVVGPDAATCTMVASLVAPLAAGNTALYINLSSMLSLCAGIIMILGGFAHLGFIVNFFARPILIGFLNGIAASIIVGQCGKLLGIKIANGDFFPSLIELCTRFGEAHIVTLIVGASTLAIASLIALVITTLGLIGLGGNSSGVALVGNVPAGLPHLTFPHVGYGHGQGLLIGAMGLVVVSFTSGMLTARSFAARSGERIDANREMAALGFANLAACISGSFAITGADSRTAVNVASGNKTQLASVVAAISTAIVAAFLSIQLGLVPLSALAAVLIFSAIQLVDLVSYKELNRIDPFECRLSWLTTAGVLTLGVLPGIAIALALIIVMVRMYKPDDALLGEVPGLDGYNDLSLSPDSKAIDGVIIWRFEGPLLFFNAEYFKTRLLQILSDAESQVHWVILSLEAISQIDATGVKTLEEIGAELRKRNIGLLVARPKVFMQHLRHATKLSSRLASESVFPTISAAVHATRQGSGNANEAGEPIQSYGRFFELQKNENPPAPSDSTST